jgi:AcrR family transcriptional regulator
LQKVKKGRWGPHKRKMKSRLWRPGNQWFEKTVIMAIAQEGGRPVPHGEIWDRCNSEIGSKATFTRYLRSLEDRKLIVANRASRKNVTFTLNLGDQRGRYLKSEIEELASYANPRSPMSRDFQAEIRELKGAYHWRLVKAAEAVSIVANEFNSRLLDVVSQRAQRWENRKADPIIEYFENQLVEALNERLVSQIIGIYNLAPSFTFAALHVLMEPRKEIQFNRKHQPHLYECARNWAKTNTGQENFDALDEEWRERKQKILAWRKRRVAIKSHGARTGHSGPSMEDGRNVQTSEETEGPT